jgi:hypothetical protein
MRMSRDTVTITDSWGTGYSTRVSEEGALKVSISMDDEFKYELKKLIREIMHEIAEGHLLGNNND